LAGLTLSTALNYQTMQFQELGTVAVLFPDQSSIFIRYPEAWTPPVGDETIFGVLASLPIDQRTGWSMIFNDARYVSEASMAHTDRARVDLFLTKLSRLFSGSQSWRKHLSEMESFYLLPEDQAIAAVITERVMRWVNATGDHARYYFSTSENILDCLSSDLPEVYERMFLDYELVLDHVE